MQPKYTHNKSNIIKITEDAKRKSRQRLIGSIVLLSFALVILLNVTAKVKPVLINPEVVEIKNAASGTTTQVMTLKNGASGPVLVVTAANPPLLAESSAAPRANSSTPSSTALTDATSASLKSAGFKAGVVNRDSSNPRALPLQGTLNQSPQQNQSVDLTKKPKLRLKAKPVNPADILDGLIDPNDIITDSPAPVKAQVTKSAKSYLQFAALSSQAKAEKLQQLLASHGLNASVQPVETENGTLYRLRAGPFSRSDAAEKLEQLTNAGYTGIITGN